MNVGKTTAQVVYSRLGLDIAKTVEHAGLTLIIIVLG